MAKQQYVYLTLSNGNQGVFVGKALISPDQARSQGVRVTHIAFTEPQEVSSLLDDLRNEFDFLKE